MQCCPKHCLTSQMLAVPGCVMDRACHLGRAWACGVILPGHKQLPSLFLHRIATYHVLGLWLHLARLPAPHSQVECKYNTSQDRG